MHIARCLGCRVLVLTLHTVGLSNTLRPVHQQAWWVVFSQRVLGIGENKWSSFWELVLLLLILVSFLVSTWIHTRRGLRHSCQRPSRPAVYLPLRGRARWVGGRRCRPVTTPPISQKSVFVYPIYIFWGKAMLFFFLSMVLCYWSAGYASG